MRLSWSISGATTYRLRYNFGVQIDVPDLVRQLGPNLDDVDRAMLYCEERAAAFDPTTAVLVHGDAHGWNTVLAGHDQFKFVDPQRCLG